QVQKDGAHVAVGEVARLARQNVLRCAGPDSLELVFEERLIGNTGGCRSTTQQAANGVIRLGGALLRGRVGKHVWRLSQVDGVRQISRKASHVGRIHKPAAGKLALDAQIEVVAFAKLVERVNLERQRLRKIGGRNRDGDRREGGQRKASVHADAIGGQG